MANVVSTAQSVLYSLSISLIILLAGLGLGTLVKRLLEKLLKEIKLNQFIKQKRLYYNLERSLSLITSWGIYITFIFLSLDYLKITDTLLYIFLGVLLMLIFLTLLVGIKDSFPNFMARFLLKKSKKIRIGSKISIREIYGSVQKIGYLETMIKTDDGDILHLPNFQLLKSKNNIKII